MTQGKPRWLMIGLLTAVILSSIGSSASASPPYTRDQQLPRQPKNVADLFVADTYLSKSNGVSYPYVDWFCRPNGESSGGKACAADSQAAASSLFSFLDGLPVGKPRLLRVGKARDDCKNGSSLLRFGAPAPYCSTGVPLATNCPSTTSSPYCIFTELKSRGINLGVVVGARDAKTDTGRPTRDLTWQACQIAKDNANRYGNDGFYDFIFLDQAGKLGKRADTVVKYINQGKTYVRTDKNGNSIYKKNGACNQGWDVIVNDNGLNLNKPGEFAKRAWGHATHYEVGSTHQSDPAGVRETKAQNRLRNAAKHANSTTPLRGPDFDFLDQVNGFNPPGDLATGPVLRFEVTRQTDRLSKLTRPQQCKLLTRLAKDQGKYSFASLFPLYNAGTKKKGTGPYDGFFTERTAARQLDLMGTPNNPDSQCPFEPFG